MFSSFYSFISAAGGEMDVTLKNATADGRAAGFQILSVSHMDKAGKKGLHSDFVTDRTGWNVGQQISLVGGKLHIGLTLQASNRWCFNNKYLVEGSFKLDYISVISAAILNHFECAISSQQL